jgi:hypothetical protein
VERPASKGQHSTQRTGSRRSPAWRYPEQPL